MQNDIIADPENKRTLTLSIPIPDWNYWRSLILPGWRTVLRGSLIFLAVTLPLAFYLRTYDSATIKITLLQLGVLAGAAAWVWGSFSEGRFEIPLRFVPIILPAGLLLLWNAARFLFSDFRLAGMTGFVMQTAFLLTFILTVIAFSRPDLRRTVLMILGAWTVVVIYGLMQFAGFDPSVWKGAFGEKIFSTLASPTLFAAYSALCAPLALALACDEERPLWLRGVAAVLSLADAWLLAWTGNSIASAIFMFLLAVFAAVAWRTLRSGARAVGLLLSAACLVMSLAPFSFLPGPHKGRQPEFLRETWKGTAALIADQPLLGSGPGSFWVRYPAFRRPEVILLEGRHNNETDHPENELLEQWADGGLPAVLLWLWLFSALLYKGARRVFADEAAEGSIYIGGLLAATAGSVLFMLLSVSSRFAAPGWLMFFLAGLLGAGAAGAAGGTDKVLALPLPFGGARRVLAAAAMAGFVLLAYGAVKSFQSDITHNLAIYYSKSGSWSDAELEYGREAPWSPAYVMGRYFLGNNYVDRGDPGDLEKALASYKEVRAIAPDYVSVAYREAKVLEKLGDYKQAIERMERQVRIDPVWDETWLFLAGLYEKAGDTQKAEDARRKALAAKAMWPLQSASATREDPRTSGGIGIDAWFSKEGILVVESTMGPADKAGIRSGDQIFQIDPKAPVYFRQKGLTFRPDKFTPEKAARVLMGEPGTKITLIVCPYAGLDKLAGKKGEPGCRGTVKIIQLERIHVRTVPEGLSRAGALSYIAKSRSF
jgi:tetratricopeptide (TPR) repeat protein